MSLRRRLLAGFVVIAAMLVVTNVALSRTVERFLLDRVDAQLLDVASRPIFRNDRMGRGDPRLSQDQTLSEYFIAVGDLDNNRIVHLSSAFAQEDSPPELGRAQIRASLATAVRGDPRPFTSPAEDGNSSWRLVAVGSRTSAVAIIGINLDDIRTTIARIRAVQALTTAFVLAALGLVSWWMLRLGVHPLENMAETADAIAEGDLSQRVTHPSESTEAGRLGVALNTMLARIQGAFAAREESEARVRRFAADASHELRTPLTSIRGYAELWRAGGLREEDELAEAMRRMEQEATRMGALVDDLLLLARLDQDRPAERSPVRLDVIAADAVRDAAAVEPDRPLTADLHPAEVEGDEMQLRQVLANLLANARLHTPPDTPVSVAVRANGQFARLEVADEGPGMPPEVAAQAFERFFRADKARSRSAGGSGLGLSIVQAVVQAHAGRASIESAEGAGTRFVVEIPLRGA